MVTALKGAKFSGVNTKGFLLTGVVLLLVVALFFIPEIVSFQKSLSRGGTTSISAANSPSLGSPSASGLPAQAQRELALLQGSAGGVSDPGDTRIVENPVGGSEHSPMEEISALLDRGLLDQMKSRKLSSSGAKVPAASPFISKQGLPALTWDSLRSSPSADALKKAENDAVILARQLPEQFPATRFALLNFASALKVVRSGAEQVMAPEQSVQFVDYSRLAVVNSMDREGVERDFYNRFIGINLGPVLEARRGTGIADVPRVFNPQITLTKVAVYRDPTRHGQWIDSEKARVFVNFSGYLLGRDVKQVDVYRNGIRIDTLKPTAPDLNGYRYFSRSQVGGRGIFTLRVLDKYGQVFEQNYSFYPRARQFQWARSGYFRIPRLDPGDRRLDRFFRSGRSTLVASGSQGFFDGGFAMEQF